MHQLHIKLYAHQSAKMEDIVSHQITASATQDGLEHSVENVRMWNEYNYVCQMQNLKIWFIPTSLYSCM